MVSPIEEVIRGNGSILALVRQNIVEALHLYAGLENGTGMVE